MSEEEKSLLRAIPYQTRFGLLKLSFNALKNFLEFEKSQEGGTGKKLCFPQSCFVTASLYGQQLKQSAEQNQPKGPTDLVNVFLNLYAKEKPPEELNGWKINYQTRDDGESVSKVKAKKQQFYNDFYKQNVESQQKDLERLRQLKKLETQFLISEAASGIYDKI